MYLDNINEIKEVIETKDIVIFYVSSTGCNACESLKPKVEALAKKLEIEFIESKVDRVEEIRDVYRILAAPTVALFVDRKEILRDGVFINLPDLEAKINRYKKLLRG